MEQTEEEVATLVRLTERYCVVHQTLAQVPALSTSWSTAALPAGETLASG